MEAFGVRVTMTDKLNFNTFEYFEKRELCVAASGRLSRNEACLKSRELAEQYKEAITKRRRKSGDKRFDAEIITITNHNKKFPAQVESDSKAVLEKLEKWK